MFLPHFDVICDLLLNRRTATWNLFVLYNKELKYTEKKAFFISNFATLTDTKIVLWRNLLSVQSQARKCDWFKESRNCQTWIGRCRHLCVCPAIVHKWEPIRMRAQLSILFNTVFKLWWLSCVLANLKCQRSCLFYSPVELTTLISVTTCSLSKSTFHHGFASRAVIEQDPSEGVVDMFPSTASSGPTPGIKIGFPSSSLMSFPTANKLDCKAGFFRATSANATHIES